MITCDQYRDLAELLRDDALDAGEAAEARAHRDSCPACHRWEEGGPAVLAPLAELPRKPYLPPPPPWGRIPPWAGGSVKGFVLLLAVVLAGAGGTWIALGGRDGGAGTEAADGRSAGGGVVAAGAEGAGEGAGEEFGFGTELVPVRAPTPLGTTSLLGRIVGPDGRGMSGVRVSGDELSAPTDGAGVFLLEGLPAGGARTLRVAPPGCPAFDVLVPPLRGGGTAAVLGEIRAGPGVEARVRVLGIDAGPLRGARVAALRTPAMLFPDPRPTYTPGSWGRTAAGGAAAGPDGAARLPGLSPGEWTFVVEAPGHAAAVIEVRVGEDGAVAPDIVLLPAATREGRVIDGTSGEPLAGAEVQALPLTRRAFIEDARFAVRAVSGPDGRFRMAGLPSATLLFAARREAAGGWSGAVVVEPGIDAPVVVAIGPDIPVDLDIVEEGTGRPLAGIPVLVRSSGVDATGGTSREEILLSGPDGRIPDGALPSGTRDLVTAAPLVGGPWAPATASPLAVGALRPGLRQPFPAAGGLLPRLQARLSLVPSGSLEGTLRDADGRPRGGVVLEAVGLLRPPPPFPVSPSVLATTWTRADGTWRFPGLAPGRILVREAGVGPGNPGEALARLEAGGPGTAMVRSGGGAVLEVEAGIVPPGSPPSAGPWSVEGRVTGPDGGPAEGVRLRWKMDSIPPPFAGEELLASMGRMSVREVAAVAGDGSFTLSGLHPGPDGEPGRVTLLLTAAAEGLASRTIAVPLVTGEVPGPVELRLEEGRTLSGRLRRPDGSPAAGVPLQVKGGMLPRAWVFGVTASDGSFSLRGLPGEANQVASGWPHEPGNRWDLPTEGGTVAWTLSPPARCSGGVIDTEGRPVPGHSVRWEGRVAEWPRVAVTGSDGSFLIEGVTAAGRLLAGGARGGDGVQEFLPFALPVPAEGAEGLELRLERGLRLSGRVEDGAGKGVEGATVQVAFEYRGMRTMRWVRSGPDGSFRMEGLPPGDHALTVEKGGAGVVLSAGAGSSAVRVRLDGGGGAALAGVVLGQERLPVEGLTVTAWPADGAARYGAWTRTDSLGRFRLEAPATGGLTVVLGTLDPPSPVYLDGVAAAGDLQWTFRRSRGEGLRGTVVGDGGRGVPGVPVTAIRIREGETGDIVSHGEAPLLAGLPPSSLRCVLSGSDGTFHLGNPAGDWVVFAGWPGTAVAAGLPEVRREGDRSPLGLEVGGGRTLGFRRGVDDDAPAEAAGVEVRLEGFLPAGAAVPVVRGTLGDTLELPGIPAGPVVVLWKDADGRVLLREER